MNIIPVFEDILTINTLIYDTDIVDRNIIGELARGGVYKNENTVRLLRYNKPIWYVSKFSAVFQSFSCPDCDTFFSRSLNLERHLTTCMKGVKNVYPTKVYQAQRTLFDKLDSF